MTSLFILLHVIDKSAMTRLQAVDRNQDIYFIGKRRQDHTLPPFSMGA